MRKQADNPRYGDVFVKCYIHTVFFTYSFILISNTKFHFLQKIQRISYQQQQESPDRGQVVVHLVKCTYYQAQGSGFKPLLPTYWGSAS